MVKKAISDAIDTFAAWITRTALSMAAVLRSKLFHWVVGIVAGIIGVVSGTLGIVDYFSKAQSVSQLEMPQGLGEENSSQKDTILQELAIANSSLKQLHQRMESLEALLAKARDFSQSSAPDDLERKLILIENLQSDIKDIKEQNIEISAVISKSYQYDNLSSDIVRLVDSLQDANRFLAKQIEEKAYEVQDTQTVITKIDTGTGDDSTTTQQTGSSIPSAVEPPTQIGSPLPQADYPPSSPMSHGTLARSFDSREQCLDESILLNLQNCRVTNSNVLCHMTVGIRVGEREQDIQISIQKSRLTIDGNYYRLLSSSLAARNLVAMQESI
jgi:hypothetical protein